MGINFAAFIRAIPYSSGRYNNQAETKRASQAIFDDDFHCMANGRRLEWPGHLQSSKEQQQQLCLFCFCSALLFCQRARGWRLAVFISSSAAQQSSFPSKGKEKITKNKERQLHICSPQGHDVPNRIFSRLGNDRQAERKVSAAGAPTGPVP